MIVFNSGDSYTQTAFDILGTKPTPENPIGNPTYPGNTFSGGANWIEYEAGDRILPPPSEHLENTITFGIFDPFITNRICLKFKRLV